jgi:hypothetical protein
LAEHIRLLEKYAPESGLYRAEPDQSRVVLRCAAADIQSHRRIPQSFPFRVLAVQGRGGRLLRNKIKEAQDDRLFNSEQPLPSPFG